MGVRQTLFGGTSSTPLANARWLVVDVESTGLDTRRDRLLAIGAVAVVGAQLDIADSFETLLRQDVVSDHANILIHRIGGEQQRAGDESERVMNAFSNYVTRAPTVGCVGFHAAFDEAMIAGEWRRHGHKPPRVAFLDLAYLAPALLPRVFAARADLDDWLAHFGVTITKRHHAVADAWGTAQLFLCLLAEAQRQGIDSTRALFKRAEAGRWLQGSTRH